MARSIEEIHQGMLDYIAEDETLSAKLFSTSKTSIYRLFLYIIATATYLHEVLFDEFTKDVQEKLDKQKTHNKKWYADAAKKFQFGYALHIDADYYDIVDENAQIIKHAAVDENNGTLIMKVAKEENEKLAPLNTSASDELTPFSIYVNEIKDAGVVINIISAVGDLLSIAYNIFYNPLVLDENGKLLNNSTIEPVKDTIKNFIKTLPFNGEFIPVHLTDALQKTTGVVIPELLSCQTRFANNNWKSTIGKVVPYAGYLTIADENLILNYEPNI